MKEIKLQTNQFLNLTAEGVANTKILLQNQGPDVMYIFKQSTTPTMADPAMALFNWQSIEVDNLGGDIWVASQQAGTIFVTSTSGLGVAKTIEFPPDMYTSVTEGFRRLRVDPGQTGFFSGKMFNVQLSGVIPTAGPAVYFRFTAPVDFILWTQSLELTQGAVELEVFTGATPAGAWTSIPVEGVNSQANRPLPLYTPQCSIATGGSFTGGTRIGPKMQLRTASGNNRTSNVGGLRSERGRPAGVYYGRIQTLTGGLNVNDAAQYLYDLEWEERPV